MIVRFALHLTALLICVLAVGEVRAQSEEPMRQGIEAFREGRYQDAVRAFEEATRRDPTNAEAHFLLARVFAETPLKDERRAREELDRAMELEPRNVTYLVGRLQQLRKETWNFFQERVRERKRIELARQILQLDSTNAFAHEELGTVHIRDFWRYRNAVMLPSLTFGGSAYQMQESGSFGDDDDTQTPILLDPTGEAIIPVIDQGVGEIPNYDPNEVFAADRFDVDKMRRLGVPIQDLAARAQRAYDRAIGHLKLALETDPRRESVYGHLMEIYALKGEYSEALDMLEEMHAFFPETPKTWLYLGHAHYRSGNMDAAAKSFETAFTYMSEEEQVAFESLEFLLPEEERARLRDDPVAYASRFWTSKDPRYLTPYNERKLEHYARLVYADLLYGSEDLDLRGWETQRGQILVRYGVPEKDVVLIPGSTSRIATLGVAPGSGGRGPLGNPGDEIQPQTPGPQDSGMDMIAEANAFNIWDYGEFRFVFEDPFRNGEYRLYSPSAKEVAQGVSPWINDYSIKARETFRNVPERYEYTAPGRQIELPYLVNAFRGSGQNADVYVHYGVPLQDGVASGNMVNLTANVGAFLISDQRDILVERRRTIYGLKGEQIRDFDEVSLWVDTQYMDAPPGRHQVSMEFETASGSTVAVQRREIEVPDFTSEQLMLSDVLLAYGVEEVRDAEREAGGAIIVRRGLAIDPAPWSVFAVEQPIYLYFEIYNLSPGADGRTDYRMEARLTAKDERRGVSGFIRNIFGGTEGVSVALPGSGESREEGHYLILDASNQEQGLYTLTLRVRDNVSGKAVDRQMDLYLE